MGLERSKEYYEKQLLVHKIRYETEINKEKPSKPLVEALLRTIDHYQWCVENSK